MASDLVTDPGLVASDPILVFNPVASDPFPASVVNVPIPVPASGSCKNLNP